MSPGFPLVFPGYDLTRSPPSELRAPLSECLGQANSGLIGWPFPIVLLKYWKVSHCNAKKLLKNCQKSKKLLPKFQKLPPKLLLLLYKR